MARGLTAGMQAQVVAPRLRLCVFVEIDTISGVNVYVWSGVTPITWNGHTWIGAGGTGDNGRPIADISPIIESSDLIAQGIKLSLSGVPSALVSEVLSDLRQGLPAKTWFGSLDSAGAVIADPYLSFSGQVDVPEVNDDGKTAVISVTVESRLIALERANNLNYSNADQQLLYPGDRGFEYVDKIQETNISMNAPGRLPQNNSSED